MFLVCNVCRDCLSGVLLQTQFGIVYSCVEDKLFHAHRGGGAFLNGQPLHASGQEGDITHDITHDINTHILFQVVLVL